MGRFYCHTYLQFPLLHLLPLLLPAVVLGADGRGDVSGVGPDLQGAGLFVAEVVAPLKVLLALQETLALLLGVVHVLLDQLVVRRDPEQVRRI